MVIDPLIKTHAALGDFALRAGAHSGAQAAASTQHSSVR